MNDEETSGEDGGEHEDGSSEIGPTELGGADGKALEFTKSEVGHEM